jgi:hypothetical protein
VGCWRCENALFLVAFLEGEKNLGERQLMGRALGFLAL